MALKILRPERADEASRYRLIREARIVARLRDDHVVGIYEVVDPPHGYPYLVMEYLDGPALADMIRQSNLLAPRRAAAIIAEASNGLAAAHDSGLVHRDVKPSNILIDPMTQRAKVADFGLASEVDGPRGLTRDGVLPGTPAYMSPEQARGDASIDHRSDVYSLGVTLYEAITGEEPFRGSPHMVLAQIREDEPMPPRRLSDAIDRDLETICLRAMAKERDRRYASARAMGDDLRRWLGGKPILARHVGPAERAWSWCRRNPRIAGLAATVAVLLATLATISTLAALRIDRARKIAVKQTLAAEKAGNAAKQAQALAEEKQAAAAAHFGLALEAMNTLVFEVQQQLAQRPGTIELRQKLGKTAIEGLNKIAKTAEKTSSSERTLVVAHERMGEIHALLGNGPEARKEYERSRDMAQKLMRKTGPNADLLTADYAKACDLLGDMALSNRALDEAGKLYQAAIEAREKLLKRNPGDSVTLRSISVSYNKLGDLARRRLRTFEAIGLFEKSLSVRNQMVNAKTTTDAILLSDLRFSHGRIGDAYLAIFDWPKSLEHYQQSLAYSERLLALDPKNHEFQRQVHLSLDRLGNVYLRLARHDEAVKCYKRVLADRSDLAKIDSKNAETQHDLSTSLSLLGDAYRATEDFDQAEELYKRSLETTTKLLEQDPTSLSRRFDVHVCLSKLGELAERRDRYDEAERWIKRSIELYSDLKANGKLADPMILFMLHNDEDAIWQYESAARGLDSELEKPGLPVERRVWLLRLKGLSLARLGRSLEAEEIARELKRLKPKDVVILSTAVRIYSLCSRAANRAARTEKGSKTNREIAEHYTREAIQGLLEAVELDLSVVLGSPYQPDLDALANEPTYQKVVDAIQKRLREYEKKTPRS